MRCNFLEIQLLAAKTLRNLCTLETCTSLLISRYSLSDLIVIALLRTSLVSMKNICTEIFYNMLCHERTRMGTLQSPLSSSCTAAS